MVTEDRANGSGVRGAVRVGQLLVDLGLVTTLEVARAVAAQRSGDRRRLGEILVAQGACATDTLERVLHAHGGSSAVPVPGGAVVDAEGLRELVSVRDALLVRAEASGDPQLLLLAERLDRVVADLAAGVPVRRVRRARVPGVPAPTSASAEPTGTVGGVR